MHAPKMDRETGDNGNQEDLFDEDEPQVNTSFGHTIIVDGLPVVPGEKLEKLTNVVRKFFMQVGTIVEQGLEMPTDSSGKSLGCASTAPALTSTARSGC